MAYFEFPHTRTYDSDLGWLIKTMKTIIENVQAQDDKIAAVEQLAQDLKDFVNNYFDNLDVQAEINNKIDQMAADGTLAAILDPEISSATAAWLAANITPTSPAIDASLTVSGAGADALITGANVNHVLNDIESTKNVYLEIENICDFEAVATRNIAAGASATNQWIGLGHSDHPVRSGERIKVVAITASAADRQSIFSAFDVRLQEYDGGGNTTVATTISTPGQIITLRSDTAKIGVLLRVSYNNTGTAYTEHFKVGCAIDYAEYGMLATMATRDISALTDLDDALESGNYMLGYSAVYANDPVGAGTRRYLITFPAYGISTSLFRSQMLIGNYNDPFNTVIYFRYQTGGTWTAWKTPNVYRFRDGAIDIPDADFNNAVEPGSYLLAYGTSFANAPEDTANTRKMLETFNETGNVKVQRLTIYQDSTNANTQTFCRQWVRYYASNTWRRWMLINPILENGEVASFTRAARNSQGSNTGTKLRVMSYNVAAYNNDTSTYITDPKLVNLIRMLGRQNADIVGVQEDRANIDSDNSQNAESYIWYPQYPVASGSGGVTIHSKTTFLEQHIVKYSTGRLLRYVTMSIDNKTVLVCSTHPYPGATAEAENNRAAEYQELFRWLQGSIGLENYNTAGQMLYVPTHTHAIICGDMNSLSDTDKQNLTNSATGAGYIMGNGGRFGWFYTSYRATPHKALDNIIVSNNIIINGITALHDEFDNLYSDHVPVVADLTLK